MLLDRSTSGLPPRRRRPHRLRGAVLALGLLGLVLATGCGGNSGGGGRTAAPPQLQSIDRASQYPGQLLTLQGSGFTGADLITFGGIQALTFSIVKDTEITVTVPPGVPPGTVTILVHTPAGTSAAALTLEVLPLPAKPVVTDFQPQAGGPGRRITLTGTGFGTVTGVRFGGVAADPATIQRGDDTTFSVLVPAGARPGLISVDNPGGTGQSNGDFQATLPPTLANFTPSAAPPGEAVTLTGTGFTGATAVLFAGAAPGTSVSATLTSLTDTRIGVLVPAAAATGVITVETPHGAVSSAPAVFTVQSVALAAADFNPKQGPEGTEVTITGSGLGEATGVTFGGIPAVTAPVPAAGGASLAVKVPPAAVSGPVQVLAAGSAPVTVPGGAFTVQSPPLVVTGFTSAPGGGGLTVTITGANLGLATGVSFAGGVTSTAFTVLDGGNSLTVPVPAGAVSGPMSLVTAGGPVPVPGGDLAVPLPPAPAVTGFDPAQGVPGTEVTLTGSGFAGANRITYANVALDPERFDVDSDTRIRVRVPDDAQANGAFGVTTPGGGPAVTGNFVLLPSRRKVLPQAVVKGDGAYGTGPWLDFPTRNRAAMYGLVLPQTPVFHAYNPDGLTAGGFDAKRPGHALTRFTLNLKLPDVFYDMLPADLRNRLQTLGIPRSHIDIFVNSQDYQYDGLTPTAGVYLFRPHYWTDPLAPVSGLHFVVHNLQGGIFDADAGVTIAGPRPGLVPNAPGVIFGFSISTHCPVPGTPGEVVASDDSQAMAGFDVNQSTGLWSLVHELASDPPGPANTGPWPQVGRAAVTLHLLFNDADQAELDAMTPGINTMEDLLTGLAESPALSASRGVAMFLALGRPVVNTVARRPLAGTANEVVVLTGTGLSGPVEVRLDGVPVDPTAVRAVSDAIVEVTLPAGTVGNLQVGNALGPSDPVALP